MSNKGSKKGAWIVYLHGEAIDRITDDRDKETVKNFLVEQEGYDPSIILKRPWEMCTLNLIKRKGQR